MKFFCSSILQNFFHQDLATTFRDGRYNKIEGLLLGSNTNETTLISISQFIAVLNMETVVNIINDTLPKKIADKFYQVYSMHEPFALLNEVIIRLF
jgi:hypothetical protein